MGWFCGGAGVTQGAAFGATVPLEQSCRGRLPPHHPQQQVQHNILDNNSSNSNRRRRSSSSSRSTYNMVQICDIPPF
jgi:hypothetical protein